MSSHFENFGLSELVARPEDAVRLASLAMVQGRRIAGYEGDYYRCELGDAVVAVRTRSDPETGEETLLGMDTQGLSHSVWELSAWESVPQEDDPLTRRVRFWDKKGQEIQIDVINAGVRPWRDGSPLRLVMTAFPEWVAYGVCEVPSGTVPSEEVPPGKVLLQGTVKDPKVGKTYLGMEPLTKFLSVTVDTPWGEIEVCHALEAVAEEQKDNVVPGAAITALCTLTGDAATGEYADGAVFREDKALELLAEFFRRGGQGGLGRLFRSDGTVTFLENTQEGQENALSLLTTVAAQLKEAGLHYPAEGVLTAVESGEGLSPSWYPGKCCLLLGQETGEAYAFLCLVDTDSLGRVREITITNHPGLSFEKMKQQR